MRGLFLALVLIGAGGCGDKEDVPRIFAGTWTFELGELDCPTGGFGVDPRTMPVTEVGPSSLDVVLGPSCDLVFSLRERDATALPDQSCAVDVPIPGTGTQPLAITSWRLSLDGDTAPANAYQGGPGPQSPTKPVQLAGPMEGTLAACPAVVRADGRTLGAKRVAM
jgi:hypothetical protein